MKKFILVFVAALSLFGASAGAVNVGDKVSESVYSDLAVYVNHYPIPAYVINDYAVIVAEDLTDYCCDVLWDGNARTLNITKSEDKTKFTSPQVYKTSMPTGTKCADVLYTDIKTYVNGKEVTSFNVNGRTMIVIDEFGNNMDGYAWVPEIRAAKAWLDGKHIKEYKPLANRTETLFHNDKDDYEWTEEYESWYDFDFDEKNERIKIDIINHVKDLGGRQMRITIGNKTLTVDMVGHYPGIDAVYVCDIDTADGFMDLAVVITQGSDDPVMYIFKYDTVLTPYEFQFIYWRTGETTVSNGVGTGYVLYYYFNVNDDNTITLKTQTYERGEWHVYRTYYKNQSGIFEEDIPEYYEILPDWKDFWWREELQGYERTMWEKGYVKAYITYMSNGFTINRGEYFKPMYDNGQNYIYVVKENGSGGWIYIGYDVKKADELNNMFFRSAD